MKKIYLFIYCSFYISCCSFAQSGTWTWISGDSASNAPGAGTVGSSSINNHPQNIYEALEWNDKQGNFWLYGGFSLRGDSIQYNNTDLWKFNPLNYQWTWVKGDGYPEQPMYGAKGVANLANTPGQRTYAAPAWTDTSGNLWLCGGAGHGDDIWKYTIGNNEWTWVAGDTTPNKISHHGTLGMPGALTTPGNRYSTTSAWTDSANNLWLFGGFGFDDDTAGGGFDDLFKFNISTKQWTWVNGSSHSDPLPVYGPKGVETDSSEVGGRFSYTNWMDTQGNFWIMGGLDYDAVHFNAANDVWKYDIYTNKWAWMSGADTLGSPGDYHASCTFDILNSPGARSDHRASTTDSCGKFWLFGGGGGDPFNPSPLNDLWVFDPQQVKWNLVMGTDSTQQPGTYGIEGVASALNIPPPREGAVAWWGNDNKFYVFGGEGEVSLYADMWVFNPDTACVPSCNAVVAVPPPVASFQSDAITFCAGSCIGFTNLSTNSTSWSWNFHGAADSISTSQNPQNICYSDSGAYNVTLIAYNNGGRDSVTYIKYIYVKPSPPAPSIHQTGNTLYFTTDTSYASYQWYNGLDSIANATDTFLVITQAGNYNLDITGKDGCKISTGTNISVGIQNYNDDDNSITLYPNPAGNELRIKNSEFSMGRMEIYNALGQLLYQSAITDPQAASPAGRSAIDISAFPSGVYFLRLNSESGIAVRMFVKE